MVGKKAYKYNDFAPVVPGLLRTRRNNARGWGHHIHENRVSPSAFRKCPSGHRHAHMIQFLYLQRMWVRQVMENILVNITISPSSREPTSIPQLTHTPVSLQWSPSMEHLIITRRRMRFEGARGSMVEWNGLGESEEARAYVRV